MANLALLTSLYCILWTERNAENKGVYMAELNCVYIHCIRNGLSCDLYMGVTFDVTCTVLYIVHSYTEWSGYTQWETILQKVFKHGVIHTLFLERTDRVLNRLLLNSMENTRVVARMNVSAAGSLMALGANDYPSGHMA